jgi:tetratricopeptide (TPR) repeat protein
MDDRAAVACPDANTLLAFVHGQLAKNALGGLERHLARCSACGDLVAELAVSVVGSRSRSAVSDATGDSLADLASLECLERVDPSRFRVWREIARGGMGRVVEAWDRRHLRTVAVKLLVRTESAAARARFVREARVMARLDHPNIVALYEAGRWSDDEPFLLMKLVDGKPLDAAVREAERLEDRLALLPNVVAMTEALAYAHDRRIIHRDLKPANVLLGAFGETVVIDWGLAKLTGEADPSGDAGEAAVSGESHVTRAGAAIGTPSYMAPEQARGEVVDARADVYALGALLYHVLAGAPPYGGGGAKATIERVLAGPPPALASRARGVPKDLGAIVAKAMAREPGDRYADARAMSADLRRFTSGQLVGAHAYSIGALLRRWVSRHRAVVATACALLSVLVVSSVVSVRRIVRERDRADALKVMADGEKSAALVQRDAGERLVGYVLGHLRERLEALGKLDLLAGVGSEVDAYYRSLGPTNDALDAAALMRRGRALYELVEVERRTRSFDSAAALARSAILAFDIAHRKDPRDVEASALLVVARTALAGVLENAGRVDDGLGEAKRATEAGDALVAGEPSDARAWVAAAFADGRAAFLLASHGDVADGGRAAATRAGDRIARAGAASDLDVFWQDILGGAYRNLGGFGTRAQDWAATAETCRAAIELRRGQLRAQPDHAEHVTQLAYMLRGLGLAEEKLGDPDAALAGLHESITLRAWLIAREPDDTTARYDQGIALAMTCDLEREWHGAAQAEKDCDGGRAVLVDVLAAHPGDAKAEDALSRAYRGIGRTALAAKKPDDAWRAFDQAVAHARRATESEGGSFTFESSLIDSLDGRATSALALRRIDAARADARDAVGRVEKQMADHPKMTIFEADLALRLVTAGDVARAAGDAAGARRDYAASVDHGERALAADSEDVEAAIGLAMECTRLASVTSDVAARASLAARAQAVLAPLEAAHRVSPEQRAQVDGR